MVNNSMEAFMCMYGIRKKKRERERKGKEIWYCALCKLTADSAHEDVWERWALGSRNV